MTFIIWKWKNILVLENPFSNPCYSREISLYFGALTVVSASAPLENEIYLVPPWFWFMGFNSGLVKSPWLGVLFYEQTLSCNLMCLHSLVTLHLLTQSIARSASKNAFNIDETSITSFVCKEKVVDNYILYVFVDI